MYVTNGDKEQRWDEAVEIAKQILDVSSEFEIRIEPPKFRRENSDGEITIALPSGFSARENLKKNIAEIISLADEFVFAFPGAFVLRWNDVYIWREDIHAANEL